MGSHTHTHTHTHTHKQGAALGTMVGFLTFGNRKYESLDSVMRQAIAPLHEALQQLLPLADQDSQAFNDYLVREGGERFNASMVTPSFLLVGCTETTP